MSTKISACFGPRILLDDALSDNFRDVLWTDETRRAYSSSAIVGFVAGKFGTQAR